MTATAEVRFGPDGQATVHSYIRLTASTYIQCCTYPDAAPILSIHDGAADITITNPGKGEVTEDDVTLAASSPTPWPGTRPSWTSSPPGPGPPPQRTRTLPGGRRDGTANGGGAARAGTSGRPWCLSRDMYGRGEHLMRRVVTGEQVAQIYNPDPFARPVFRAPVYRTPAGLILIAWLVRLIIRLLRLIFRHPAAALVAALLVFLWVSIGWIGVTLMAAWAVLVLVIWWHYWPVGFARWVATPARSKWRAWGYRRKWAAVTSIADLAPWYQGRIILPVLVKVTSTRYVDRVHVRLVSGQCAADFADRADNLAHGFGALLCRVRTARSGAVVLEFVRRDALAAVVPALPVPDRPDLAALPVGRREDGLPWLIRLHGTHLLIAGATGAGKASLLWGLVRAMLPLMRAGLVRMLAADPKLMELAYGRVIFDTYGAYAANPAAIAAMLDAAVADMQARAARFAGQQRDHTPNC